MATISRFKPNCVYSGELVFGGCGCLDTNKVTMLKRTKNWLVYKEQFTNRIVKCRRGYMSGWGDCINTQFDDFYAYNIENNMEAF